MRLRCFRACPLVLALAGCGEITLLAADGGAPPPAPDASVAPGATRGPTHPPCDQPCAKPDNSHGKGDQDQSDQADPG
jgi:hypothetical protein